MSKLDRGRLEKIVEKAGHVVDNWTILRLYTKRDCTKKTNANIKRPYTPNETTLIADVATGVEDFLLPRTNTNRYKASFLPSAL